MLYRKPVTAALLSCLMPGLGQVYNGEVPKALFLWVIGGTLWFFLPWYMPTPRWIVFGVLWALALWDSVRAVTRINQDIEHYIKTLSDSSSGAKQKAPIPTIRSKESSRERL